MGPVDIADLIVEITLGGDRYWIRGLKDRVEIDLEVDVVVNRRECGVVAMRRV